MNILNVGYGIARPQARFHLVQSNVSLRLEDPRDEGSVNIELKTGSGVYGANSNTDWKLSTTNSSFKISSLSNNNIVDVFVANKKGDVIIPKDMYIEGNLILNNRDLFADITSDTSNIYANILYNSNLLIADYTSKFATTTDYIVDTCNLLLSDYTTKFSITSQSIEDTSNLLQTDYTTKFAATSRSIEDTSNLLQTDYTAKFAATSQSIADTSNLISQRITDLSADSIADGVTNRFIINDKYNSDLEIIGDLKASNLIIYGENTILYTDVYTTEQLKVENQGLGSALVVKQINSSYSIFNASNSDSEVFTILNDGSVGIGGIIPSGDNLLEVKGSVNIVSEAGDDFKFTINGRDIITETSNYVLSTSNFLFTDYSTKFSEQVLSQETFSSPILKESMPISSKGSVK